MPPSPEPSLSQSSKGGWVLSPLLGVRTKAGADGRAVKHSLLGDLDSPPSIYNRRSGTELFISYWRCSGRDYGPDLTRLLLLGEGT